MKFYNIPGNENYQINELFNIKRLVNKNNDTITIYKDKITITLYGVSGTVTLDWLYWISRYKIFLPVGYTDNIFNVVVSKNMEIKNVALAERIITFKVPVVVKGNPTFRVIARYPDYAITKEGRLLNIKKQTTTKKVPTSDYPTYNIYTSYSKSRSLLIHRLVALTWCHNVDFVNMGIVNHKDGDKRNFNSTNLEWGSLKDNSLHAKNTGLKGDSLFVVVRNIKTGEEVTLPSVTEAAVHIGRTRINLQITPLSEERIWRGANGIFEMRSWIDNRPWYYTKDVTRMSTPNQKIKVTIENEGKIYVCGNSVELRALFKDKQPIGAITGFKDILTRYKSYNPKAKVHIEYTKQYATPDEYLCLNVTTKETKIVSTRSEASVVTGIPKSSLQKTITTNGKYAYNGWVVKVNDGKPFSKLVQISNQPEKVRIWDTVLRCESFFPSTRQAAASLGFDKGTIRSVLENNRLFKNRYAITRVPQ